MASDALRRAWTEIVAPDDYEAHMGAIGQAEANAYLIKDLIERHPLDASNPLLFAGAGTGQMFDYVAPAFLKPYDVTFTDIRSEFLDRLKSRMPEAKVVVDDIESTRLEPGFKGVALVLVLEHVRWRVALEQMIGLGPERFYLIVQINPPDTADAVAPNRVLPPSLASVPKEAKAELLDVQELGQFFADRGWSLTYRQDVPVPDGKTMAGLVFTSCRE